MSLSISDRFRDQNELKRFARYFIKERVDSLKKDVDHCLKAAVTFPAILYSMSMIYLLGELYSTDPESDTTGNSIKYMQEIMGYNETQSNLVMKLFRHKLVHLALPRPVVQYPDDSGNVVAWEYHHYDRSRHLILETLPVGAEIQIKTDWKIKVQQKFIIAIRPLVEDIEDSVYRHGGYLDRLEHDTKIQHKFAEMIEGIYNI